MFLQTPELLVREPAGVLFGHLASKMPQHGRIHRHCFLGFHPSLITGHKATPKHNCLLL